MIRQLPLAMTFTLFAALLLHGPIVQFADYHHFADQSNVLGIPHAGDVLSNLGFALVAFWGWWKMRQQRTVPAQAAGATGEAFFIAGLLLTAFGSSYYHLAPDNARLVWDRLPIAISCAGLLAATHARYCGAANELRNTILLGAGAIASVLWWRFTDLQGMGDLRWYLSLQILPVVLIPLWQATAGATRKQRLAMFIAIVLYALAKGAELRDHEIQALLQVISGHTIKHLLATFAALALLYA